MTKLKQLRELLAKATPGKWGVYQATPFEPVQVNHPTGDICEMDTWTHRPDEREPDAHLIAASHNAFDARQGDRDPERTRETGWCSATVNLSKYKLGATR